MSVGHVARAVEEAGIPTVTVMVRAFRYIADQMTLPRTVITPFPMGRPLGAAFDRETQMTTVTAAFDLLDRATGPGEIVDLDLPFRPGLGTSLP